MLRRAVLAFAVYLVGATGLLYWSISGFNAGAPREDWALMIVLPVAWIVSYWPMLGSLLAVARILGLRRRLEAILSQIDAGGDPSPEKLRELEDFGTALAAGEYRLPEFIVRPFIRKGLDRIMADDGLRRVAEEVGVKSVR